MTDDHDALDGPRIATFALDDLATGPTAALFEGGPRAGIGITSFVVRTPPGRFVELHLHPYTETFFLLEGTGRWTAGEQVHELTGPAIVTVPPHTLHGFRNIGDVPLQLVTIHESPVLIQEFTEDEPA